MAISQDGYALELNQAEKKVMITVSGKFVPEKQQQFEQEYTDIIKQITPSAFTLYVDCTDMQIVAQQHIDNLGEALKMYKSTGFNKVVMKVSASAVIKMQLNRIAKSTGLDLEFAQ